MLAIQHYTMLAIYTGATRGKRLVIVVGQRRSRHRRPNLGREKTLDQARQVARETNGIEAGLTGTASVSRHRKVKRESLCASDPRE